MGPTGTSPPAAAGAALSTATARSAVLISGARDDLEGDRSGDRAPIPRRKVAGRHDRLAAGRALHDGATRAGTDRRGAEGPGSAAVVGGPVCSVHRRADRKVSPPSSKPPVRNG